MLLADIQYADGERKICFFGEENEKIFSNSD